MPYLTSAPEIFRKTRDLAQGHLDDYGDEDMLECMTAEVGGGEERTDIDLEDMTSSDLERFFGVTEGSEPFPETGDEAPLTNFLVGHQARFQSAMNRALESEAKIHITLGFLLLDTFYRVLGFLERENRTLPRTKKLNLNAGTRLQGAVPGPSGEGHHITGDVDYSVFAGFDLHFDLASNLVCVVVKPQGFSSTREPQIISSMALVQKRRMKTGVQSPTVYGILSNSSQFYFFHTDAQQRYSVLWYSSILSSCISRTFLLSLLHDAPPI
ncbi:hypothetical protein BO70DRAFT_394702 [Aspergillus heteromorphus CBS 117.55]|uniref:Uncharacterized protein n=1 Tax=Aspergillus heteromorphus CBS 117.55 TaxID=1448321 RepID=A0A317WKV3_9EURO|nr:uncharacterized protein BO70DRAFT_394702 [Aspergillus heteromorphus CBS 117.55]PWY86685.1 hypothetical protein BO70DRAFT_394702 [Aspergillus heteromorphus CBS 117.55]